MQRPCKRMRVSGAAPPPLPADPLATQPQVFINHTGPNQNYGAGRFAEHLADKLNGAGVSAFMDYDSLPKGEAWPARLRAAAADSRVFVAVVCRAYTLRFWPMHELDLVLQRWEAHQRAVEAGTAHGAPPTLILPVVYERLGEEDVQAMRQYWSDPASLAKLSEAERGQVDAERWASNLALLSEPLQAYRASDYHGKGGEVALQRDIVARVLEVLTPPYDAPRAVGFECHIEDVLALLEAPGVPGRSGALCLWLHGLGGAGKTTLAELVFDRLQSSYQPNCFVSLRLKAGKMVSPAPYVQEALIGLKLQPQGVDVLHHRKQLFDLAESKPLLLVVDNVWSAAQMEALLPPKLAPGGRVLMTARSADFGKPVKPDYQLSQYALQPLDNRAARQLLRRSADRLTHEHLPADLAELEDDIISACGGLPLALVVVGGYMRQQTVDGQALSERERRELWQGALRSLRRRGSPNSSDDLLEGVMALSFDSLTPVAKHMFLDVVSVLAGQPCSQAMAVWKAWHDTEALDAFRALISRSLISTAMTWDSDYVERREVLGVHDVVQGLGRDMLNNKDQQKTYGARVWAEEDGSLCPQSCDVRGRVVSLYGGSRGALLEAFQDADLSHLRIALHLKGHIPRGCSKLLWLQVEGIPQEASLPAFSHMTALRHLDLRGCESLTALPEGISQLTALQTLDLRGCKSLTALPQGISQLTELRHLDLRGCKSLTALPAEMSQLATLQTQDPVLWQSLVDAEPEGMPEGMNDLTALQTLDLSGCESLRALPEGISQLTELQRLALRDCQSLTALPEGISHLTALQALDLDGCKSLTALPEGISQLTALQRLDLSVCKSLTALPQGISQLTELQTLDLSYCELLTELPEGISQLTELWRLELQFCVLLTPLPEGISRLTELVCLDLSGCMSLMALPEGISQLTALRHLDLRGCMSLTAMPEGISQLTALETLDLSGCESLTPLPEGISRLTALQTLNLSGCMSLTALPEGISQLTRLRRLDLSGCESLTELPEGISHLTELWSLELSGCTSLTALPEGISQRLLQRLDLSGCRSLTAPSEGNSQLTELQEW